MVSGVFLRRGIQSVVLYTFCWWDAPLSFSYESGAWLKALSRQVDLRITSLDETRGNRIRNNINLETKIGVTVRLPGDQTGECLSRFEPEKITGCNLTVFPAAAIVVGSNRCER